MPLIVIVYTAYDLLITCSDQDLSKFGIKGWWMFTRDRVMEEVYEGNRGLNGAIIQYRLCSSSMEETASFMFTPYTSYMACGTRGFNTALKTLSSDDCSNILTTLILLYYLIDIINNFRNILLF